jgi:hypothetical protein
MTTAAPTTAAPTTAAPTTAAPISTTTAAPHATYYVDLSQVSTGDGTIGSPFNLSQFITEIPGEGDIYKIKGSGEIGSFFAMGDNSTSWSMVAWDAAEFKPWRLHLSAPCDLVLKNGEVSGGIIENTSGANANIEAINFNNMFFRAQTITLPKNSSQIKGCTLVSVLPMSGSSSATIIDSIIDMPELDSAIAGRLDNCVFTFGSIGPYSIVVNNCQFSWTPPSWPHWNSAIGSFSRGNCNYSTINSGGNPRPGVGYPNYTGYSTELSGAVRDDIGAYTSLEPTPTTAGPTTIAPTTAAPTTAGPTSTTTTVSPTTVSPTTVSPTTVSPTTVSPTTSGPTTTLPPGKIKRIKKVKKIHDNTNGKPI